MCGITRGVSRGSLDIRARSIGRHRAAGLRYAVTSCRRRFSDLPRVAAFRAETAATNFVCVAFGSRVPCSGTAWATTRAAGVAGIPTRQSETAPYRLPLERRFPPMQPVPTYRICLFGVRDLFLRLTALMTMLSSCTAKVAVVNVDAGFKGGYLAGVVASRVQAAAQKLGS